jgi:hypothetical protein
MPALNTTMRNSLVQHRCLQQAEWIMKRKTRRRKPQRGTQVTVIGFNRSQWLLNGRRSQTVMEARRSCLALRQCRLFSRGTWKAFEKHYLRAVYRVSTTSRSSSCTPSTVFCQQRFLHTSKPQSLVLTININTNTNTKLSSTQTTSITSRCHNLTVHLTFLHCFPLHPVSLHLQFSHPSNTQRS